MNLIEKLLEIRKVLTYFKKENENEGQNFKYVSSSQVLKDFRTKADELGVMIIPQIILSKAWKPEGSKQLLTELTINYDIINVEDPEDTCVVRFYAQGMDMGEKGVGKALTYGEKYLLLKLFNIPTDEDDPDGQPLPGKEKKKSQPKPEDDEKTRFEAAIKKLTNAFKIRDGNANAIKMMAKVLGFEKMSDIVKSDDRTKFVTTLLNELDVKKLSDVVDEK